MNLLTLNICLTFDIFESPSQEYEKNEKTSFLSFHLPVLTLSFTSRGKENRFIVFIISLLLNLKVEKKQQEETSKKYFC